jgi:hypothetical protein
MLNLKTSNFTKYDLLDHVNTVTAVAARTPDWTREDYIVRSWLYGSISDEPEEVAVAPHPWAWPMASASSRKNPTLQSGLPLDTYYGRGACPAHQRRRRG